MRPEEQLGAILDETTVALARFDLDGLLELLQRAEALRIADCEAVTGGAGRVTAKHKLLGAMLRFGRRRDGAALTA